MYRKTVFLIAALYYVISAATPFRANLVLGSIGSWMVFSREDKKTGINAKQDLGDNANNTWQRPYFFNKFAVTTYCQIFGLSGMFKIPVSWPLPTNVKKQRIMFGDFDCYVGKRFGWIVPRLGCEIPLGYAAMDKWKNRGWIGSNNFKIQGGFSISRTNFEQIGLPFGMDGMVSVALSEKNARYERGAIGGQLYIKTSKDISKKVNAGAELAVYGKSGVPTWNYPRFRESGFTLLPALFGSYRLGKKLYIGIKGGFGPSFTYIKQEFNHKSNSCDAGMSLQYYP